MCIGKDFLTREIKIIIYGKRPICMKREMIYINACKQKWILAF